MTGKRLVDAAEWLCYRCGIVKNIDEFYSYNGKVKTPCKECKREYQKQYKEINYDKIVGRRKERDKQYRIENKERFAEYNKAYNKAYRKRRASSDITFKLRLRVSKQISDHIKTNGSRKNKNSIIDYLPYSFQELNSHLDSLFSHPDNLVNGKIWMNESNYGTYIKSQWNDNDTATWKWSIDHIIPHSKFNYTSMEDQAFKDCWALTNLRPYSAKLNHQDGISRKRH